jgi:hypothetical protein
MREGYSTRRHSIGESSEGGNTGCGGSQPGHTENEKRSGIEILDLRFYSL